jgi:outer membrane cobalamin receptor
MKKTILYIFLTIFSYNISFAQLFSGKILDNETKEPIVGAAVKVIKTTQTTVSNAEGKFNIISKEKEDSIKVSLVGYQTLTLKGKSDMVIFLIPNTQQLQSIVITANREAGLRSQAPIAISKLSPKLIDESKATMVYELINKTPGVIMPSYNNEQHAMAIRQPMGTSAYYLYMEDGIPIRPLGVFNHNAILEINQFALSSIEVVKGPVSSIYGPEAVGGAINFILQRPTLVPTARVGVQLDNWGFRRVQFGAGAKIKKFGFYFGGLNSQQTNSWMASSDYDKSSINARLEYNFTEKTRLIGNFVFNKYYSQMSGSVDSAMFYNRKYVSTSDFTYRKSDATRSRITLEHDWNNNSKNTVFIAEI